MQEYENAEAQSEQIDHQVNLNDQSEPMAQPGFETGDAPYVQEYVPEQPELSGDTIKPKRGARRARREPPVVTPLIADKLKKRMMNLPPKTGRSLRRKQSATDVVIMLMEPIKEMLARGYNVADVQQFFEQNGVPISSATIRTGMIRAGVLKTKRRASRNNKGGAE